MFDAGCCWLGEDEATADDDDEDGDGMTGLVPLEGDCCPPVKGLVEPATFELPALLVDRVAFDDDVDDAPDRETLAERASCGECCWSGSILVDFSLFTFCQSIQQLV